MTHRDYCLAQALAKVNVIHAILNDGLPGKAALSLLSSRELTMMKRIVEQWQRELFAEIDKTLEPPEEK